MAGRGIRILVGIFLFFPFQRLVGQACGDVLRQRGPDLARRYAPVLAFAPGEQHFPTVPFFPAFEGGGLADSAAIAPLDTVKGVLRVSWDSLEHRYLTEVQRGGTGASMTPPVPAVFYQLQCVSGRDRRRLFGFLKNDPQAFHRLGIDTLFRNGLEDATYLAITYYLYYTRDGGLEGHAHDVERIVVFRPLAVAPAETRRRQAEQMRAEAQMQVRLEVDSVRVLPTRFAIVVGTGHSSTTPNNVLVVRGDEAIDLHHPSTLIELGGHSSAPDYNRDAAFDPGLDINYNLAGATWGTRDVQSIAGLAYLGAYKNWMTIPRTRGTFVTLVPSEREEANDSLHVEGIIDTLLQRGTLARHRDARPYSLLSTDHFQRLDSLLTGYRARGCPAGSPLVDAIVQIMEDSIRPALDTALHFSGFAGMTAAQRQRAACVLGRMGEPLVVKGAPKAASRAPWVHPEYEDSRIATLKRTLFRPTMQGLQGVRGLPPLLALGATSHFGGIQEAQIGLTVPVFAFAHLIAVPGVLEFYVGPVRDFFCGGDCVPDNRTRVSVTLLYDRQYRSTISWYLGLDRVRERRILLQDGRAGDVAIVGGLSLMPLFFKPDLVPALSQRVRFRLGAQIWQRHWEPTLAGFEFRTSLYWR